MYGVAVLVRQSSVYEWRAAMCGAVVLVEVFGLRVVGNGECVSVPPPPPAQVATGTALNGANITVSPEGLAKLFASFNTGSAVFDAMRTQSAAAFGGREELFHSAPAKE